MYISLILCINISNIYISLIKQVAAMAVRWNGWMPPARSCRSGKICWIVPTFGWRAVWFFALASMEYAPICHRHSQRHNLHCSNLLPSYTNSIYMYMFIHMYIQYIHNYSCNVAFRHTYCILLYCIVLYCINYELCSCYIIGLDDKHYQELKNEQKAKQDWIQFDLMHRTQESIYKS